VLAGESIRSIVRDWNARQIPSSSGKTWQMSSLRGMITGPRIAGRRVFRGADTGPAVWPAIITYEEHLQILATIGNPRITARGRPPTQLLTSMLRCGLRGATLTGNVSSAHGQRFARAARIRW